MCKFKIFLVIFFERMSHIRQGTEDQDGKCLKIYYACLLKQIIHYFVLPAELRKQNSNNVNSPQCHTCKISRIFFLMLPESYLYFISIGLFIKMLEIWS